MQRVRLTVSRSISLPGFAGSVNWVARVNFSADWFLNLASFAAGFPMAEYPTMKQILDVGNCDPDHQSILRMLRNAFPDSKLHRAHGLDDTLQILRDFPIDLVFVNRKLDQDYSDGIEIVRAIKKSSDHSHIPMMLITNYEEYQKEAMEAGALRGFGKLELSIPATIERIAKALS